MFELRNIDIDCLADKKEIIVGIGSEHCGIKFVREANSFLKSDKVNQCRFRLITPKTDQNHIEEVINIIESASGLQNLDSVIVNDFGILYHLKDKMMKLTLGRILAGSYGYRPDAFDRIHSGESLDVIMNYLAPSILHKRKIELYMKYGMTGVELCAMPFEEQYVRELKSYGLKLHIHYASSVAGISKVCYHKKRYNIVTGDCSIACNQARKLTLDGYPTLYLLGNIVYFIDTSKQIDMKLYDTVIFDNRYCNWTI